MLSISSQTSSITQMCQDLFCSFVIYSLYSHAHTLATYTLQEKFDTFRQVLYRKLFEELMMIFSDCNEEILRDTVTATNEILSIMERIL